MSGPTSESQNNIPEDLSCTNLCYKEDRRSFDKITTKGWTTAEGAAMKATYDSSLRYFCVTANLVGRPCTEVHNHTRFMRPAPYATNAEDELAKGSARCGEYGSHLHDTAPQPMPCYYPGLSLRRPTKKSPAHG